MGGRLQNAKINFDKKHQIILCPNHNLPKLIIRFEHSETLHAGPQALLAALREKYWPVNGKNLIKKVIY